MLPVVCSHIEVSIRFHLEQSRLLFELSGVVLKLISRSHLWMESKSAPFPFTERVRILSFLSLIGLPQILMIVSSDALKSSIGGHGRATNDYVYQ
jgi:hypothetical protein